MTTFITDAAYMIGSTHRVCQDYARAGIATLPFAVVSDGCSSSNDTDCGARLLALAFSDCVRSMGDHLKNPPKFYLQYELERIFGFSVNTADAARRLLGLPRTATDATLLALIADEQDMHVIMGGDGVVVFGYRSGECDIISLTYPASAPRYPRYELDPATAEAFMRIKDNQPVFQRMFGRQDDFSVETRLLTPDDYPTTFSVPLTDLRFAAVLSDGAMSLVRNKAESIPLQESIARICQFKSFTGEFVLRRLRAVQREFAREGIEHTDDLSIAAIAVEDS